MRVTAMQRERYIPAEDAQVVHGLSTAIHNTCSSAKEVCFADVHPLCRSAAYVMFYSTSFTRRSNTRVFAIDGLCQEVPVSSAWRCDFRQRRRKCRDFIAVCSGQADS
jgi:hypothetical protein